MPKFFKRTKKQKQANKNKNAKRTRFGIKNKLQETWKGLGQQSGSVLFTQLWDSPDLTELETQTRGLKKRIVQAMKSTYKNRMPGYRYTKLIKEINLMITGMENENVLPSNIEYVQKETKDFYAFKGLKKRARHLTKKDVSKHQNILARINEIIYLIEAQEYNPTDKAWLENVLLKDLIESEQNEKLKMMKEFGLL